MTEVVIYAALSKKRKADEDDRHDDESIDSQVAKVQARLAQLYGEDVNVVGVFDDAGFSGSKGDRGPGLEAAILAATRAAADHGRAELWANTSARFARGTGGHREARALGALYYDLKRVGVAIRSVHDDEFVMNEMLVGFASAQAAKYSADLSESVTRAKRRQAERGEHLGGPKPLGYASAGSKQVVVDPATVPVVRRIFALAAQGVPDGAIARTVNAEGHRSRAGHPFDRRAVQAIVTNAFYAGLIVYEGDEFDALHEPLVDRTTWRTIQAQRQSRDHAKPDQHRAGRPAKLHLLTRLARCAECGSPMFARTSPYRRKDGTKARSYACRSYGQSDGTCSARPVDAELVDTAVMERLHDLLPDFEGWITQIEDRHADERGRLADLVDQAERDRDKHAATVGKHERQYRRHVDAGNDTKADLASEFVEEARRDLADAETRLTATRDALATVPVEAPRGRLLDFAVDLRDTIAGKTANARSVEDVNRILLESFDCFAIAVGDWLPADEGVHAGSIKIDPVLRPEVAHALLDAQDCPDRYEWPAPPMEWIEAVRNSAIPHE
jgi:DNA invertase Pin-like site-specific DNA recombinase